MSQKFRDAKEISGLSYADISKRTGLARCTVCRVVNDTWRTKLLNAAAVGKEIGLSNDEIFEEWNREKAEKAKEKAGI